MDGLAIVAIAVCYLVIFLVGYWAPQSKDETSEQFLLAGRKLPLWIGLSTMTATWVGGGYVCGTAEAVFSRGLIWAQAPWCYALSLIIGGLCFAGIMRRRGYMTMLDPFAERYGTKVAGILYLPALTGEIFWSAAILAALGYTFSAILSVDFAPAVVVSSAVAVVYTMVGGLAAVAYTDVVQLAFFAVGICVALPFVGESAGGWGKVLGTYFAESSSYSSDASPLWTWSDNALLLILGGIPWGVYFQRVLASQNEQIARRLSYWAGACCMLMAIPSIMIGMLGSVIDWQSLGLPVPESSMVLPYALKHLTPFWVGILGAAVIAAAVMSSIDSSILSASSMFVWNILFPFLKRDSFQTHQKLFLRTTIAIMGVAATCLALKAQSVYGLWYLCSDLVYVVLFPQLVMVLFCSFANATGALWGFCVALTLRLLFGEETLGLPALLSGENIPFRTMIMLTSLSTIALVSLLYTTTPESAEMTSS